MGYVDGRWLQEMQAAGLSGGPDKFMPNSLKKKTSMNFVENRNG